MDRKNRHETVQNHTKDTRDLWARPPLLLPALWQASHSPFSSFVDTSTRAVANTFKNYESHRSLFRRSDCLRETATLSEIVAV